MTIGGFAIDAAAPNPAANAIGTFPLSRPDQRTPPSITTAGRGAGDEGF
ncbi:MAG: hypothetical protein KJZ86_21720 [Caldilineaceae bacterium]|nr:hypothetical protein [Caldilineaceae bacterium]HRJ43322.1 hypothetical protein [Caldilineaceae bacterium]